MYLKGFFSFIPWMHMCCHSHILATKMHERSIFKVILILAAISFVHFCKCTTETEQKEVAVRIELNYLMCGSYEQCSTKYAIPAGLSHNTKEGTVVHPHNNAFLPEYFCEVSWVSCNVNLNQSRAQGFMPLSLQLAIVSCRNTTR